MANQPKWVKIGTIGDVNPVDYGGGFVFVDATGIYPPEVEYYEADSDDDNAKVRVYRFIIEPCTYIDGVLSDNPYHPDKAVWFADKLPEGLTPQDFTTDDVYTNARAWYDIGLAWGFDELDGYPLVLTRQEAEQRASR